MYAFSSSRGPSGTGRQFIAVDTPLGKSVPSTKLIRPTSQYVTEYEASYKWPPHSAYRTSLPQQASGSSAFIADRKPESVSHWHRLISSARELANLDHEKPLMDALIESLADHKLNLVLEYANSRLVDQMLAAMLYKEENGEYPSEVSEGVLDLLRCFTCTVAAIKEC